MATPPIFKTVFIFNYGRRGWSEVWYQAVSTIAECESPARNFAGQRARLLADDAKLEAIRISLIGQPQQSFLIPFDHPKPGWESHLQMVEDGALYRMVSGSKLYSKSAILRCISDDEVKWNDFQSKVEITASWKKIFDGWVQSMIQNGMHSKIRLKTGAGATEIQVTNITVDGDGLMIFSIAGLPGGPGDRFSVKGATGSGKSFINGVHHIKKNEGGQVTTRSVWPDDINIQQQTFGKARPWITDYIVMSSAEIVRPATHQTGRAFFAPAGRRRVQL